MKIQNWIFLKLNVLCPDCEVFVETMVQAPFKGNLYSAVVLAMDVMCEFFI